VDHSAPVRSGASTPPILPLVFARGFPHLACAALHRRKTSFGTIASSLKRARMDDLPTSLPGGTATIMPLPHEAEFFDLCRATAAHSGRGTVVRAAGGWVRDKLLGLGSDDLDIAVDNCTGLEFAESMKAYLESEKAAGTLSGSASNIRIHVIKANPDQSKHLETATVKVGKLEVDMTNLRTETYTDGSRIPTVAFGTPEEDAHRRDLTMNALFYNVSTRAVEDLTGRGLADLFGRVCRTPLAARETFLDDPLRLARAVRFAVRFRCCLDAGIGAAAKDPTVREAMARKVSRERFGKELEGMLSGSRAHFPSALRALHGLDLLPILLAADPTAPLPALPAATEPAAGGAAAGGGVDGGVGSTAPGAAEWESMLAACDWLDLLLDQGPVALPAVAPVTAPGAEAASEATETSVPPAAPVDAAAAKGAAPAPAAAVGGDRAAQRRIALLASAVLPFRGAVVLVGKKAKKPVPAAGHVLLESLKLKSRDATDAAAIVGAVPQLRVLAARIAALTHEACALEAAGKVAGEAATTAGEVAGEAATTPVGAAARAAPLRLEAGLLLRGLKGLWRPALAVACAHHLARDLGKPLPPAAQGAARLGGGGASGGGGDAEEQAPLAAALVRRYGGVAGCIEGLGLEGCWLAKPLLNGNEVAAALGLDGGRAVGDAMRCQVEWQLLHPAGTADEFLAFLRAPGL